jgi:hypothetical protein
MRAGAVARTAISQLGTSSIHRSGRVNLVPETGAASRYSTRRFQTEAIHRQNSQFLYVGSRSCKDVLV